MRCSPVFLALFLIACGDADNPPATPAPSTPAAATPGTCPATGVGASLKIDGKDVRVDLTRKRVFTAGTVVEFGFEDTSTRKLELDEFTFGIKTFVKQGEATLDWKVEDLESGVISLYRLYDLIDATGERLSMHYRTPNGFSLASPGFTLTRVGDQATMVYKGKMVLDNLAPDDVPKEIEVDGCLTLPVR